MLVTAWICLKSMIPFFYDYDPDCGAYGTVTIEFCECPKTVTEKAERDLSIMPGDTVFVNGIFAGSVFCGTIKEVHP
jgi:hypothetical protein